MVTGSGFSSLRYVYETWLLRTSLFPYWAKLKILKIEKTNFSAIIVNK